MRSTSALRRGLAPETERSTPLRKSTTETPRASILVMSGFMFIELGDPLRVLHALRMASTGKFKPKAGRLTKMPRQKAGRGACYL